MLEAICKRAFFHFEFPIRYRAKAPRIDGALRDWDDSYLLPYLVEIEDDYAFADVYAAWNDAGFYIAFHVPERSGALKCDATNWWKGDGVRVCIDTRDARDNRRATRFCHFFYALPMGGGRDKRQPIVNIHNMSRAKETPPGIDVSAIEVGVHIERHSWSLELGIPASCLHGWSPGEHPRIGFCYKIKDSDHGSQHLIGDDTTGWNVDPSSWASATLERE
ncbi:MAG: hypothetical protein AB7N71_04655 [Phycisphaerae bacterium]